MAQLQDFSNLSDSWPFVLVLVQKLVGVVNLKTWLMYHWPSFLPLVEWFLRLVFFLWYYFHATSTEKSICFLKWIGSSCNCMYILVIGLSFKTLSYSVITGCVSKAHSLLTTSLQFCNEFGTCYIKKPRLDFDNIKMLIKFPLNYSEIKSICLHLGFIFISLWYKFVRSR